MKKLCCTIAAVGMIFLLVSCPQPLTESVMNNARDETAPEITITSPSEYSSYGRTIRIEGSVSDLSEAAGVSGQVETLTWEILTQTLPTEAVLETDGSFVIEYETTLEENIVFSFVATDWNGNSVERRLPLVYEGNDIPTLSVEPGNRRVEITWDDVPGVETYTLYLESSSLAPTTESVNSISGITSPYIVDNLKNGTTYSFLLQGSSTGGPDNFSSVVRSIPLSSFDLVPRVQPAFNNIRVEWTPLEGIDSYEVMRSDSPAGPFSSISGAVTTYSFTDSSVRQGEVYYYGVKPAENCDIVSESIEGRLVAFPPYRSAEVAHYMTPSYPMNSAAKDQYLFIADYSEGLHVVDITVPSVPLPVTVLDIWGGIKHMAIDGNTLYATGTRSLYVIDITDPTRPTITGSVEVTDSQAEGIDVYGDLAAIACFNSGFVLVDVSDPADPAVVHTEPTSGGIFSLSQTYDAELAFLGGYLHLFISSNGNTPIYRITGTASSPTLTGRSNSMYSSDQIAISDNGAYAYLANSWYITSYSLASLTSPTLLNQLNPSPDEPVEGVAISGNRAYITMRDTGFAIIDIENPSSMSEMIVFNTPGEAKGITVQDGYAFISDGYGYGLHIYGVAEPADPVILGTYSSLTEPTDLAIQDDYLFITETANDWQVSVLDISDPGAPNRVGSTTSYTPVGMKIVGDRIFFAAERSGTMFYDISDPTDPRVRPPWYVNVQGGDAVAIDVLGRYSAVATEGSMLNILDLSWDDNIATAGVVTIGTGTQPAEDIVFKGDYAYVADSGDGLRIIDLSDPKWPEAVSSYGATANNAMAVEVVDDLAFVADSGNGLYVFDVSDPTAVSTLESGTGIGATDVAVQGDLAILACGTSGIRAYNIHDPSAVSLILSWTGVVADRLLLAGDLLYVLDEVGGELNILDLLP